MKKSNFTVNLPLTICGDGDGIKKEGKSSSYKNCHTKCEQRDDNNSDHSSSDESG